MSDFGTTQSTSSAAGQAQEKAQQVAGQAQEKVQQAAGQAQDRVRTQVDQRSTQAGEQLQSTVEDVRSVGEELRKQGKEGPAKVADQAADRAERVAGYLRDSSSDQLLSDLEDFGRARPWAVALGGLALGFAASRVLRASSGQRYRSTPSGTAALPATGQTGFVDGDGLSDRDLGGPTSTGIPAGDTPTGATGTRPSPFEPHA